MARRGPNLRVDLLGAPEILLLISKSKASIFEFNACTFDRSAALCNTKSLSLLLVPLSVYPERNDTIRYLRTFLLGRTKLVMERYHESLVADDYTVSRRSIYIGEDRKHGQRNKCTIGGWLRATK